MIEILLTNKAQEGKAEDNLHGEVGGFTCVVRTEEKVMSDTATPPSYIPTLTACNVCGTIFTKGFPYLLKSKHLFYQ